MTPHVNACDFTVSLSIGQTAVFTSNWDFKTLAISAISKVELLGRNQILKEKVAEPWRVLQLGQ